MTVVAKYGSGLVRTQVVADEDGWFTWIRTAGPERAGSLEGPPPAVRDALRPLETRPDGHGDAVRCALPRIQDGALHYPRLPGRSSLARRLTLLSTPAPTAASHASAVPDTADAADGTEELLYGLGRLLRRLHATPLPAAPAGRSTSPPMWRRLRAWVASPADGPAERLHRSVRSLLGTPRWRGIEAWLDDLAPGEPLALVHGAPSLGRLVPAERPGSAHALVTGEDVGYAPAQWDVGWVVAELREMQFFSARLDRPGAYWEGLAHSFLRGYGPTSGALVGRAAALRVLLHLLDFSVLVTWDDAEVRRVAALIVQLVDEEGSAR
ncbi:phosphotransferase [Streptomyces leeuwenhoekii]|uniref:phosphotransferase n=1 Tax=Streptomyces leeuwenhoekii TaxID=1437453 RepID=UPI003686CA46